MVCKRLTLLCWYLVGVVVRDCQPVELDVNANLQKEDLEQTLENAGLQVVDTQRTPVIHRKSNTSDDAEAEQTEADQQASDRRRADWFEEEEEGEDEEKEEEWLPVYDGGKQVISGQHREGKRVRKDGDGKNPELQEGATNGHLQYTTLDPGNQGVAAEELTEAGNGETDASGEDKEGQDDDEASKDSAKVETGSEDEPAKEGELVKEQDGEVKVKAEAPSDDEEEETPKEDTTQYGKETSKQDDISKEDDIPDKKEPSDAEGDTLKKDDTPKKDGTQKKGDISNKDDTSKNDEAQKKNEKIKPTRESKKGEKRKEESKDTSRSSKTAQNEEGDDSENGSAEEHLKNLDPSKEQHEEPASDDDGSGDEEDEGNIFVNEIPATAYDTSDDSPAADEEQELIPVLDDEVKKHQTPGLEGNAENSRDKQPSTEEDKKDSKQGSRESDEDKEGSGEAENQNSESKDGKEKKNANEKDDTANKKQLKGSKWKYYGAYGPGNWSREFSGCNSDHRFQSPISIVPDQARFDDTLKKISFSMKHNEKPCNSRLFNDAQTAKVIFENMVIHVIGLDKSYQVAEVQFHWGNTNNAGSEHIIASKRYPLEMQVLCYDEENFPDLMEAEWMAENTSYTIVVLATLFELSNQDNPLLSSVVENLKSIQSPGQNISIPSLKLGGLLPKKSDYFYRYSGSLTSPPCQAEAEWIVFHEHQTVSPSQLEKFRQLHEEEFEDGNYTVVNYNWRPIQPLTGRVVTRSFPIPKKGNPNTQKPRSGKVSMSSSHLIRAIDVSVYILLFVSSFFLVRAELCVS